MPALNIFMNAEEMGRQFPGSCQVVEADKDLSVGLLQRGMESGKPSVSFLFTLPDGTIVFAETSLVLFLQAAYLFEAAAGRL